MSTRRSSRRRSSSNTSLAASRRKIKASIQRGLESLAEGNESYIAKMLSIDITAVGLDKDIAGTSTITCTNTNASTSAKASPDNDDPSTYAIILKISNALQDCMSMNNLTPEMLLARFFDDAVLSVYSKNVLGKSGKGSAAILAARITKEWSKDSFQCLSTNKRKRSSEENAVAGTNVGTNVGTNIGTENDKGDNLGKKKHCVGHRKGGENEENENEKYNNHDEDQDDWRKPLFYWKGRLVYDNENKKLKWDGSWVAGLADTGLPDKEKYEETKKNNKFNLTSVGKLKSFVSPSCEKDDAYNSQEESEKSMIQFLAGKYGTFKGQYLLDQGDGKGPRNFRDLSQHFAFDSSVRTSTQSCKSLASTEFTAGANGNDDGNDDFLLITACGSTKFGNFVSAGYIEQNNGEEEEFTQLILARRYIDENDSRQELVRKKSAELLQPDRGVLFDRFSPTFWTDLLPWKST
jgi:hypothetical protein